VLGLKKNLSILKFPFGNLVLAQVDEFQKGNGIDA
jgi:hypothetical protein